MSIEYKRYSVNAHTPKTVYPGSAGYDLWAAERKVLKPWSRELIRLNFFIAIPEGYYGRRYYSSLPFPIFPIKNMWGRNE